MENFESTEENNKTITVSGAELLDQVAAFIRKYLVCDDHQLTILTLWSARTHSHEVFTTAPYLDIRSPERHCGKTLCLDLLHFVAEPNYFFTGASPRILLDRLLPGRELDDLERDAPFTVLLDDCHHTFAPSERQPLLAFLNAGCQWLSSFAWVDEDYFPLGPKAFASNTPLPRSLASRCIPIVLRRPRPSENYTRYQFDPVIREGRSLHEQLSQWMRASFSLLCAMIDKDPPNLPPTLSPGQRNCAESLLYVADLAGGSWPAKARAAVSAVFDLEDASTNTQLLFDIRNIFFQKNNPEYLATSDLLSELCAMDARPWSAWNAKSGRRIGTLLRPFRISSTHLHPGKGQEFKGYRMNDLQEAWDRYLPPLPSAVSYEDVMNSADGNGAADKTKNASVTPSVTPLAAIDAGADARTELDAK
jgi:hypothetical protein